MGSGNDRSELQPLKRKKAKANSAKSNNKGNSHFKKPKPNFLLLGSSSCGGIALAPAAAAAAFGAWALKEALGSFKIAKGLFCQPPPQKKGRRTENSAFSATQLTFPRKYAIFIMREISPQGGKRKNYGSAQSHRMDGNGFRYHRT